MDVKREVEAANRRIQRGIDRNYLIATARLEGMTPEAYAEKVDAERAAATAEGFRSAGEVLGYNLGVLTRAFQEAAESMARGFQAAMHGRSLT